MKKAIDEPIIRRAHASKRVHTSQFKESEKCYADVVNQREKEVVLTNSMNVLNIIISQF